MIGKLKAYFCNLLELGNDGKCADWRLSGEAAGLALFAATVCISISLAEIGLGIAAVCRCLRLNRDSFSSGWSAQSSGPLFHAWMFYLAAALLTALTAVEPALGLKYLPSDLLKCGAFFLLLDSFVRRQNTALINIYFVGAAVAATMGLTQVIFDISLRAHGTLHPVTYAETLFFPFSLALCMGVLSKNALQRRLCYLLGALLLAALISSQTRGVMIASGVFFICAIIFSKEFRHKTAFAVLFAIVAFLVSIFMSGDIARRVFSIPRSVRDAAISFTRMDDKDLNGQQSSDGSTGSRIALWHVGRMIWMDNFWLGVGPANLRIVYDNYNPYSLEGQRNWGNVHSLYLQQAAERGLVGLCAVLWLFATFWRASIMQWKILETPLSLWAVAAVPAFAVMNISETSFQHALPAFSAFLAIATAQTAKKQP